MMGKSVSGLRKYMYMELTFWKSLKIRKSNKEPRWKLCDRSSISICTIRIQVLDSKWTPLELGYSYEKGKTILVYLHEKTDSEPGYLQLYQSDKMSDRKLVFANSSKTEVEDRIKQKVYGS